MALDKWQQRQAEQYARDNNVSVDEAIRILFPDEAGPVEPEAGPTEGGRPEGDGALAAPEAPAE